MPAAPCVGGENGCHMIRAAVFDFDGTLFDSMPVWDTAGEDFLRSAGISAEKNLGTVLSRMSLDQAAAYLRETYCPAFSAEAVKQGITGVVRDAYAFSVLPKPGVPDFLDALARRGIRMCIATASERPQIEAALRRCGLQHFFAGILTCSDAGYGKDEPVIFREALRLLDSCRRDTLVFEDALHALQTAKADGFFTVAVPDAHEKEREAVLAAADIFLPDFFHPQAFLDAVQAAMRQPQGRRGGTK